MVAFWLCAALALLASCRPQPAVQPADFPAPQDQLPVPPEDQPSFYLGVDLSYANELDDCGAIYLDNGQARDVFELFSAHGANLVRARLWHNPAWTEYSTLSDVERTFERARKAGLATLLDFHYSDDWADPGNQSRPAAWETLSEADLPAVVYQYTYDVLMQLHTRDLLPDLVQIGNETNSGMLKTVMELDWPRDAKLFNAGIQAVRAVAAETGTSPKIILHVAQPENLAWWFDEARQHGITDYDMIGFSYYPQWSSFSIAEVGEQVAYLRLEFGKDVMLVETAYPWTLEYADEAPNLLAHGLPGYPISIAGQRQFLIDLTQTLIGNGGLGVVYWEPAWISTQCSTRWGQGSHWENATFFDFQDRNELHRGIDFLNYPYRWPTEEADGVLD